MTQKEYDENKSYLDEMSVCVCDKAWADKEFSAELECYTRAGGDMFIWLEVLDKEHLQEYIDNFNINDEVMLWWHPTHENKTPFSNMKEHYEDLEEWLEGLQEICDGMPH